MNKLIPLLYLVLAPYVWAQGSYNMSNAVNGNYTDLAAPTAVMLDDEELSAVIAPAGFSFDYFGQTYTSFKVGSNGYIIMGDAGTYAAYSALHSSAPGLFVAPLWCDLKPEPNVATIGWDFSNGVLTVEWRNVKANTAYGSSQSGLPYVRMQAVLDTATGEIHFHYGDPSGGYSGGFGGMLAFLHQCAISGPMVGGQEVIDGQIAGYVDSTGLVTTYPEGFQVTFTPAATAPTITSTPVTAAVEGQAYSYDITTTGYPAPTLQIFGKPNWLTLSGSTLSGTPGSGDVGNSGVITLTADNVSGSDDQQFTITVDPAPTIPQITSTPPTTAVVGVSYSYQVTATGNPAPSFSTGTLPGWLVLTGDTLAGTPGAGDVGVTGLIMLTASNAAGDDNQQFSITVDPAPVVPQITSAPVTTATVGNPYSYQVSASGSPAPVIVANGLPPWLTQTGDTLSGTPTQAGTSGLITIEATNSAGSDQQQFTITVANIPAPPVITSSPPIDAQVGELFTYTLTATGSPAPVVNFSGLPTWLNQTGNTISGMPGSGDVGTTGLITATATNTSGTDTQQFSIVVELASVKGGGGSEGGGCATGTGAAPFLAIFGLLALALRNRRSAVR